jgi:hypothetical protein
MPTLHPWSSVEIGDQDIFTPVLPSLVVYTWYVDDQPESTVTHIWRDEGTGIVHHEYLLLAPVTFEEAVAVAQAEAPKRNVERIHVKHARGAAKDNATAKATPKGRASKPKRTGGKRAAGKRRR